jgi:hypothetical protein
MAIIAMAKLRRLDDRPSVYDGAPRRLLFEKHGPALIPHAQGLGAETCRSRRSHVRAVSRATYRSDTALSATAIAC